MVDRGRGVRFYDVEGRGYLDFESGQVCASTGHAHPKYVKAMVEAAQNLVQTSSAVTTPAQIVLAQKLAGLTGGRLRKSFFASTGGESNEAALRLAKLVTGRPEVGALLRGYHGMTLGAFSLSGFGGHFREGYGAPMPGERTDPVDPTFRRSGARFPPPPSGDAWHASRVGDPDDRQEGDEAAPTIEAPPRGVLPLGPRGRLARA